ncbi:MAG: type III secretion system chaperone [Methylocystis sp.]|uniref:type III secretion system chaperone n=1 Tax=Methylocystis sp. TaxID=1911079 RepID=UPI003DA4BE25
MQLDPALKSLMNELGDRLGVGAIAFNERGSLAIRLGDAPQINLQYRAEAEEFHLYADLGAPAAGPDVYGDLLRGNLFWRLTFGATLSLSGDDPPHVILAQAAPWRGETAETFAARLDSFANVAEDWAGIVAAKPDDHPGETSVRNGDLSAFIRV